MSIRIFIISSRGILDCAIDSCKTILDIKLQIADAETVSINCQSLFFNGIELENDKPLNHYNVANKSFINLLFI